MSLQSRLLWRTATEIGVELSDGRLTFIQTHRSPVVTVTLTSSLTLSLGIAEHS